MAKKFLIKHKVLLVVLFLVILSTFLRFYKLSEIYIFGFDEEYQATYAWSLVKDPHPIWIGVSASFLDYYMGPYFTYFSAILLALFRGDPMITAYFAAIVGAMTSVVIFFIGRYFFNFTTGIITSFLHASLPLFIYYDQKYWNPMFTTLVALGIFVVLNLIKKNKWWWLVFTIILGVVINTDLTPAPFLLVGAIYFIKDKFFKDVKLIFVCFLIFLFFYWPLIIFDINHNFSNLTAPFRLIEQSKKINATFKPSDKFRTIFDSLGRIWYLRAGSSNADEINISCTSLSVKPEFKFIDQYSERTNGLYVLPIISLILLIYFLKIGLLNKKSAYQILVIMILVKLFFYLIYQGGSFEYYILDFLTLFLFIPAILIDHLNSPSRYIFSVIIVLVIILGINTVINVSGKFGLDVKKQLISEVMNIVGDSKFSIDGEGICHNYEGWRYLFKIYGRVPDKSYTDKNFAWLYPDEKISEDVEYEVVLAEDRLPKQKDLSDYMKIERGGYSAYIKKVEKNLNKKSNF